MSKCFGCIDTGEFKTERGRRFKILIQARKTTADKALLGEMIGLTSMNSSAKARSVRIYSDMALELQRLVGPVVFENNDTVSMSDLVFAPPVAVRPESRQKTATQTDIIYRIDGGVEGPDVVDLQLAARRALEELAGITEVVREEVAIVSVFPTAATDTYRMRLAMPVAGGVIREAFSANYPEISANFASSLK